MTNLMQLSKEWYLATALYDSIDDGNLREAAILVQEKHANPNVIIPDFGITPFHLAVGHENEKFAKEITQLLLKNGGNPNVVGTEGVTPLHVAAAWNRSTIVRILLSYGADPWIVDDLEKNSFHYAYEEHAWETLKTLEIYRRTQHVKSDENQEKNYNIWLDKVIIHSNDVQAEYRALCNGSVTETTMPKQNAATQTPLPFSRIQLRNDQHEAVHDQIIQNSGRGVCPFDACYDWCDKASDVVLTEDCRRKIISHRVKSNVYEYSPKTERSVTYTSDDEPAPDTRKKFFPVTCCFHSSDNQTDESESKDDSLITVEERPTKTINGEPNQTTAKLFKTPENLVTKCDGEPRYPRELFSEDSLISDDQNSDCKSAKGLSLFSDAKDIPFIDASVSGSSLHVENSSQKEMNVCEAEEPKCAVDETGDEKRNTVTEIVPKENMKHVSWSGCLSKCACIPNRMDESDSLSIYCASKEQQVERQSKLERSALSGVGVLPETTTSVDKSNFEKCKIDEEEEQCHKINGNISVELKYTDDEDGIEFIEARLPFSSSSKQPNAVQCKQINDLAPGFVEESEVSDPGAYDTDYIRRELKKLGFVSGPMTGMRTKKLYLRKLRMIKKTVSSPIAHFIKPSFSSELEQVLRDDENWIETLTKWSKLEADVREHFLDGSFSATWRTGSAKTSFTYLLLDPRVSNNLPARCEQMDLMEVWKTFVRAIFYIGKGTRARPYEHLHEAFTIWGETKAYPRRYCNLKVKHILEIWKAGLGVVCVQAFHNLISAEAYTREAAMIDAIGLARLRNEKCGMYYGVAASWNSKLKRRLGTFLLYRAMRIFIAENEIQLKPTDVN